MQQLFQTGGIFSSLVTEIQELINEDVIITNEDGIIVACTDQRRINQFHEGAYIAMKNRENMVMTQEMSEKLLGVKEGIVLPIIIEDLPIGVLGITGDPMLVEPYARIVQKLSELFLQNTIDQMSQEKKTRNLEIFVYDWLNRNLSEQQILELGKFFDIDVKHYHQVISVRTPFKTDDYSVGNMEELKKSWDKDDETLFVRWGQGRLLILGKGNERNELLPKIESFIGKSKHILEETVYVGVGQVVDYKELPKSFDQAEKACIIAQSENRVIFEEELRFEMIQYELDASIKEKFIERTIAPILMDDTMLKTLDSWLRNNMSIQNTAEDLEIHKNTLYYRLEKIEKMTELDVNNIDHIILLYMSNRFLEK